MKCFSHVKVEKYWNIMFKGEKKYGRFIFLKELENNRLEL